MGTLESLKWALRCKAAAAAPSPHVPLCDEQYTAGFDILLKGSGILTYQEFITPQLSHVFEPLFSSSGHSSILEIGPGAKSVLGSLPAHLAEKISKYTALEPNHNLLTKLVEWVSPVSQDSPFPSLKCPPEICQMPFVLRSDAESDTSSDTESYRREKNETFDVILFCHSMYGMNPKSKFIEQAVGMLKPGGMVVVFHRYGSQHFGELVCHRAASFPTGIVSVEDDDETLDSFAGFIAGFGVHLNLRAEWRDVCRTVARRDDSQPNQLLFGSSDIMMVFNRPATALPELTTQVPMLKGKMATKNREARLNHSAAIVKPTDVQQVQLCVQWALEHGLRLSIIGGGHSGHCLVPNVVAVDMSAFNQVHVLSCNDADASTLVIAGAGCHTENIIRSTMAAGLTVPLGSRPSVGAGLWLQGGIGHLARRHGLSCDAIVGAVMVSVESGQILYIGHVPSQHLPTGTVRVTNRDMLWVIKGAGTNFGIIVSVTFKTFLARKYSIRNWFFPLSDENGSQLTGFDYFVADELSESYSADAYLYWADGQLCLGINVFESYTTSPAVENTIIEQLRKKLGQETCSNTVDSVGLFEAEMYMTEMHGGYAGGKTSSFKRCLFLKRIGEPRMAKTLVAAMENRPTPLCYLHLLQGGEAVRKVPANASAFGCRDWDFACVVTGVWPRDQDGTEVARSAIDWVYNVAGKLLPLSSGVYSADIGPDPRDTILAVKAFGLNLSHLHRLKQRLDPQNVLAYACPLQKPLVGQNLKLIILVTGESGAGKDYCANIWLSAFLGTRKMRAGLVSISDATPREYAIATGADLNRLVWNRPYKERLRSALETFFQKQLSDRPTLLEEQFLAVVSEATDVHVLIITGMRDEAPVTYFSHLVSGTKLLDVRVQTSEDARKIQCGFAGGGDGNKEKDKSHHTSYSSSFIFDNETMGNHAAKQFAEDYLLQFLNEDLQSLANMVRTVPDFPIPGLDFRDVLNIAQQQSGLKLCSSLLQSHFTGRWSEVDAIVCCEAGGFIFASALALQVGVPLALVRGAGKLPPPTVSVRRPGSHISTKYKLSRMEMIEIDGFSISVDDRVVVVDDTLASGETLCAVMRLLEKSGICTKDVSIMVVAEFPKHRGRERLRDNGFGGVEIQSLLVLMVSKQKTRSIQLRFVDFGYCIKVRSRMEE
ncbi:hypothetical protein N7520_000890 [Penicillium odoratum]|uniref:uncharacterized protein n=1 Tax=Penicillium odoratum TaxID=1167516 RepID=UPI0025496B7A|nr:uncharacterized protein N7520_000890 [Penicillium odoratum]KAJ5777644.1 hypothetical protein N7520_000890 [Penicillium odoratum]